MQEVQGRLLSTVSPEMLTESERRTIVANGTDAVFKQCLRFGFFHADPHPGNIFLLPGGKLCFIDCGMTGQLDKKTTDQLINLVAGVVKGDIDRLCRVVIELTDVNPSVTDNRDFRLELQHLTGHFQNTDLRHLNITGLLSDFFGMLQRYHIQCPGDLMLLTKALTTIEGVAEHFDPTFDVLAHVEPQIQEIVQHRHSMGAIKDRIYKTITSSLELLEDLPLDLQRFLDHARHSRFTLNLELKRIEHLSERIDTSSRIMGIAMIIAALIVASSILILADRISKEPGFVGTLGVIGLILAGINTAGFIISYLLPRKQKD
jgi:ubiquinone biosynthesis protein